MPFTGEAGGRRPVNSLGRFDFAEGAVEAMFAGPQYALQEVAFAPRAPDAPEADGWVMAMATNYETMKSEVVIGDTRTLADGPIAKVKLPFKAPGQVHGNWVSAWQVSG